MNRNGTKVAPPIVVAAVSKRTARSPISARSLPIFRTTRPAGAPIVS